MNKEYREVYLKSERWRTIRSMFLGRECFCCGDDWETNIWNFDHNDENTEHLELHHISYKRLGKEGEEKDLITVCSNCHDHIHELIDEKISFMPTVGMVRVWLSNAHIIYRARKQRSMGNFAYMED